jgi:predicted flap endonuclease-1-like 5' DNA nuclease
MTNKHWITSLLMAVFALFMVGSVFAADTTSPTILSVSPSNNELNVDANEPVLVTFSEDMDPSTINRQTVTLMRRTTPAEGDFRSTHIDADVSYSGRTMTLNPKYDFTAGQIYGNVFTLTVLASAQDLAGNSLARNYVWSFSTGGDAFNEDATTSSMFQGAPSGTPVATPTTPVTNTAPWYGTSMWPWIIGGLLLLALIIAAFLMFAPTRNEKKQVHHATPVTHKTPFGDVHPVLDLEGIGPVYNKELHAMGINNTKQLWEADAAEVSRKTGAPLASVKSWQNMAELSSVHDIGPQYAELLERSGVHTIDQLKHYDTGKLLKLVKHKQDSMDTKIQGNTPGHDLVANWIHEAKGHKKFSPA